MDAVFCGCGAEGAFHVFAVIWVPFVSFGLALGLVGMCIFFVPRSGLQSQVSSCYHASQPIQLAALCATGDARARARSGALAVGEPLVVPWVLWQRARARSRRPSRQAEVGHAGASGGGGVLSATDRAARRAATPGARARLPR